MMQLVLTGNSLTIRDVIAVAHAGPDEISLALSPRSQAAVTRASQAVAQIVEDGRVVYGINTGFGAFKNTRISRDDLRQLQLNIVRSHAAGMGHPIETDVVRAMMLVRANTLASGYSGARLETIQLLLRMIERGVHPVVPRQGSLGASGDLAPLAHIALVLIGEGEAEFRGEIMPGAQALAQAGLNPIELAPKEGLALTNGTAFMVALGCLAVEEAENAVFAANVAGALTLEALHGTPAAFDPRIHAVRPHPYQIATAELMRMLIENSGFVRSVPSEDPQDAYSLRCIPQVHGACSDAVQTARRIVATELNSVTDNPLIFFEPDGRPIAISGGNFHGEPLAIAYDHLALAMTELGNISERRLNRMTDRASNGGLLPAFLTENGGLNSGFMLTQYTAAALASENKALCFPASADSIPTSANVEDHVSNGPISGRQARRVLRNLEQILGIELMAAAQAIDFRKQVLGEDVHLGKGTAPIYELIREHIPFIPQDAMMAPHMNKAAELVASGAVRRAAMTALDLQVFQ